jgi:hypothetical protein
MLKGRSKSSFARRPVDLILALIPKMFYVLRTCKHMQLLHGGKMVVQNHYELFKDILCPMYFEVISVGSNVPLYIVRCIGNDQVRLLEILNMQLNHLLPTSLIGINAIFVLMVHRKILYFMN